MTDVPSLENLSGRSPDKGDLPGREKEGADHAAKEEGCGTYGDIGEDSGR